MSFPVRSSIGSQFVFTGVRLLLVFTSPRVGLDADIELGSAPVGISFL